jgi:Icc protein
MPLHLTPRRTFLRRAALAGAGLLASRELFAADSGASSRWALLSDTHIGPKPESIAREINMADHLRAVVKEVTALKTAPAAVFINGDCALKAGLVDEYATFTPLLKPLTEAGLPVHMTLGNHDDRANFWTALNVASDAARPVQSKHISVIKSAHANWFLLDSLDVVDKPPGKLEQAQRDWLAKALDEHKDKPALVMVHHNVHLDPTKPNSALLDTNELFDVLLPRKQVKALFYGHSHKWELKEKDGLHLVNLPAVAYAFAKDQPTGWVDCQLKSDSVTLELRAHNEQHPAHGKQTELKWRA